MNHHLDNNENKFNNKFQVLMSGLVTFLIVTAVALISANKPEFVISKFLEGTPTDLDISHFDTILYVSYLLIGIIVGIIVNWIGKRKIFVLIGCLGASFLFWMLIITPNYLFTLLMRFIQGMFTILAWQMLTTLILDLSSSENRGQNMGIYGIFLALSMGLGSMLGGYIAVFGLFAPYIGAILLNLAGFAIALVFIDEPKEVKKRPTLKESFFIVNKNPELIIPGIFNFVDRLHMGFNVTMLVLMMSALSQDPSKRGMVLGLFALPFIILQYPVGKLSDRKGRYGLLVVGSIGYGIVLSIMGYLGVISFAILIILYIILGTFSGLTGPPSIALVGDIIDEEDNAMGISFFNFLGNIGIILGPLIGGFLSTYFGYGIAFLIAGLIELVSLCICILLKQKFNE